MTKTGKKSEPKCSSHQFSLTPLRGDLYLKHVASLSYCKQKQGAKNKQAGRKGKTPKNSCLCFPVFNKDGNHATSTFILPEEQQNYMENQTKFKLEHDCRLREYSGEKSLMLQPKPKTKQYYCNVCRNNYEDYLTHIRSDHHRVSIRNSPFNRYIHDMEAKYDSLNRGRNSKSKSSFVDITQSRTEEDAELESMGMPSKRTKQDHFYTSAFCFPVGIPTLTLVPDYPKPQEPSTNFSPIAYPSLMPQPTFMPLELLKLVPYLNENAQYMQYQLQASMMMGYPFMYQNCLQAYPGGAGGFARGEGAMGGGA